MKVLIDDYNDDGDERPVQVEISEQDCWSLDHTLALVIAPALKKLKEIQHGAPYVDPSDVPERLRPQSVGRQLDLGFKCYQNFEEYEHDVSEVYEEHRKMNEARAAAEEGTDETHFERWDWVFDEMIWAFEQIVRESDWDIYMAATDLLEIQQHELRVANGLRLFGKYYRGLWD